MQCYCLRVTLIYTLDSLKNVHTHDALDRCVPMCKMNACRDKERESQKRNILVWFRVLNNLDMFVFRRVTENCCLCLLEFLRDVFVKINI